jgi:hypothetical protein
MSKMTNMRQPRARDRRGRHRRRGPRSQSPESTRCLLPRNLLMTLGMPRHSAICRPIRIICPPGGSSVTAHEALGKASGRNGTA